MQSGLGVVVDRLGGGLRDLLAAPVSRPLIVAGNLVVAVALASLQVAVLLGAAAIRGAEFELEATGVMWFAAATLAFAVAMYGAAEVLANRLPTQEEYIGALPPVAIVPFFFAGSFFPISALPAGLTVIGKLLPITHVLALVRYGLARLAGHRHTPFRIPRKGTPSHACHPGHPIRAPRRLERTSGPLGRRLPGPRRRAGPALGAVPRSLEDRRGGDPIGSTGPWRRWVPDRPQVALGPRREPRRRAPLRGRQRRRGRARHLQGPGNPATQPVPGDRGAGHRRPDRAGLAGLPGREGELHARCRDPAPGPGGDAGGGAGR